MMVKSFLLLFIFCQRFNKHSRFSPCSLQAPLLTTCSKPFTAVATKAEVSAQLAKALSPSTSPFHDDTSGTLPLSDNHQQLPKLASESSYHFGSSAATTATPTYEETPNYGEEEEEEEAMEEDDVTPRSVRSPPMLMPDAAISRSPASSSPSPTFMGLSNGFDKTPLWAAKHSTCLGPVPVGLGGVPLSGISAATVPPPVRSSVPLTRPLGVRNVIFQSTPTTTGTVASNKNVAVQVPMMYQLATPPGLLAPLLTMVRPPASSVASLVSGTIPSSAELMNSISATASIEALLCSKLSPLSANSDSEKMSFEKESSMSRKLTAEPTTGQTMPYSDAIEFGSSCSSPAASISAGGSPAPRTLASIPHSELTLDQLELKGFAEDFKTRRIKLGFTQGSVGQSLAEKGYSNFAQSTISRFEQMQLSPSNAATIRVVLEQWLIEAETPESESSTVSPGANLSMMASRKRKKRAVFTPQTKSTLDTFFLQNPRPNRQAIEEISQQLDLLPEEVRVWFCNKRQKSKPGINLPVRSLSLGNESPSSNVTTPSPSPSSDGTMGAGLARILKRRSASPPHRMPFTIEELSKSSSSSTNTMTTSPIRLMGQSFSPINLVSSDARAKLLPMVFGQHLPMLANTLTSPFILTNQIAQTRA